MSLPKTEGEGTIPEIVNAMVQKHIPLIEEAGEKGVQILCLQEIFNTPYFCPGQDKAWYESAESVPGPQAFGRNFSLSPETLATLCFKQSMPKLVFTFVTTAISLMAQDVLA